MKLPSSTTPGGTPSHRAIYFARRAREEREAAEVATSSHARQSHLEIARRYQEIADFEQQAARFMEKWGDCGGKTGQD